MSTKFKRLIGFILVTKKSTIRKNLTEMLFYITLYYSSCSLCDSEPENVRIYIRLHAYDAFILIRQTKLSYYHSLHMLKINENDFIISFFHF